MKLSHSVHTHPARVAGLLLSLALLLSASVGAAAAGRSQAEWGNDEETFVFAGQCAGGEPYRLVSYRKSVAGFSLSFYDYNGPNGHGTVQAETSPKVMSARVCRKWAEIINANYWE